MNHLKKFDKSRPNLLEDLIDDLMDDHLSLKYKISPVRRGGPAGVIYKYEKDENLKNSRYYEVSLDGKLSDLRRIEFVSKIISSGIQRYDISMPSDLTRNFQKREAYFSKIDSILEDPLLMRIQNLSGYRLVAFFVDDYDFGIDWNLMLIFHKNNMPE